MPLFFFHFCDHLELTDTEGFDFASEAEALQEAIKSAGQIIADEGSDLGGGDTWTMTVTDHTGSVICTLSFSASGKAAKGASSLHVAPLVNP